VGALLIVLKTRDGTAAPNGSQQSPSPPHARQGARNCSLSARTSDSAVFLSFSTKRFDLPPDLEDASHGIQVARRKAGPMLDQPPNLVFQGIEILSAD
jgi:hypothetical protein